MRIGVYTLGVFPSELGLKVSVPTLSIDNRPAIRTIKHADLNKGLQRIDIKFKSLCEICEQGKFEILNVATENQPADILTKALLSHKHSQQVTLLSLNTAMQASKITANCTRGIEQPH